MMFTKTQGKVNPKGHPCDSETRSRRKSRAILKRRLHKGQRQEDKKILQEK
jgi:hypothetical protein